MKRRAIGFTALPEYPEILDLSFTDNRPDQYRFDGTSPTELRGNGNVTVNVTPFKKAEEHPINQ